jgi:hypothetical protein
MASQPLNADAPIQQPKGHDLDKMPHTSQDIEVLYRIYLAKRVQAQIDFYKSRIRENEQNSDFTFRAGALILTVSALIATISASVTDPVFGPMLTLLAAVLPAFAAMISSFRQLYGWDKQATIYRESMLGLERVSLLAPDNDRVAFTDLNPIYPELVLKSEDIFNSEVSQWGQFILNKDKPEAEGGQPQDDLSKAMTGFNLSDEQLEAMKQILSAGKSADVLVSRNVTASLSAQVSDSTPNIAGDSTVTITPETAAPAPSVAPAPMPFDSSASAQAASEPAPSAAPAPPPAEGVPAVPSSTTPTVTITDTTTVTITPSDSPAPTAPDANGAPPVEVAAVPPPVAPNDLPG